MQPQRVRPALSSLTSEGNALTLATEAIGPCCHALMLHWGDPEGQLPADWATLSVAEEGRRLTSNEAVAARLRVSDQQWFYWHNLTRGRIARTALGHHTDSETVFARVTSKGEIEPLVHVQSDSNDSDSADEADGE